MSDISQFVTHDDVKKISNLQVLARQVVDGFCTGMHKSPKKGFSVEFRQHRQYVHGDDTRHLDWKVYGKSDRFYIREYEEETNLRATILLDTSGSMEYSSGDTTKHEYATRLAACLSYLMLQQTDGVGLMTFDTELRTYIPPRSLPSHMRVIVDALEKSQPGGETSLGKVFHELVQKVHRRGLLIIISDCFDDVKDLLSALAHFRHAHHEIIIFQIWDRAELEFPFDQWTRFESLEVPADFQMVDPAHLKNAYLENVEKFKDELNQGCHRYKIDLVQTVTDTPYADALAQYLKLRSRR